MRRIDSVNESTPTSKHLNSSHQLRDILRTIAIHCTQKTIQREMDTKRPPTRSWRRCCNNLFRGADQIPSVQTAEIPVGHVSENGRPGTNELCFTNASATVKFWSHNGRILKFSFYMVENLHSKGQVQGTLRIVLHGESSRQFEYINGRKQFLYIFPVANATK